MVASVFAGQNPKMRPPTGPTLGTLTLSGTLKVATPTSGTIIGATPSSLIFSNQEGLTVDGNARTYVWDGTGTAGTNPAGLTEILAGATNTPKNSPLTVIP